MNQKTQGSKTVKKKTFSDELDLIEKLSQLISEHKLDSIKFGEIQINKSIHKADPITPQKPKTEEEIAKENENLLFHSGV